MSASRRAAVTAAALFALAGAARAEGPAIDHSEIKCLVAGKYRKMPAKFQPAEVAQPRVYFRPEGVPSWYYVEMKPEEPLGHVGVLPKPTKKLVKKHIEYYVEAASRDFDTGRTPEYAPIVVAKDSECDRDPLVPLYSKNPPPAVFPALPAGFALGGSAGIGTAALVVGGGAAVAGGVYLATKDDDPPPSTAATTTTTTTPIPVTTTTTLPPGRLALACQADARVGPIPFTVKFNAHAIGGTGSYDFVWDFGDGGTSTQINPSHTFTVPGVYNVTVRATSGEIVDTCARTITALPVSADLDVRVIGAGSVSAPGIACPGDCLETYPSGTNVTLTATPSAGALFVDWGGDCSGDADLPGDDGPGALGDGALPGRAAHHVPAHGVVRRHRHGDGERPHLHGALHGDLRRRDDGHADRDGDRRILVRAVDRSVHRTQPVHHPDERAHDGHRHLQSAAHVHAERHDRRVGHGHGVVGHRHHVPGRLHRDLSRRHAGDADRGRRGDPRSTAGRATARPSRARPATSRCRRTARRAPTSRWPSRR